MDRRFFLILIALVTIAVAGLVGGPASMADVTVTRDLIGQRLAHDPVDLAAHVVTRFGSAAVLLPLAGVAAAWLAWRGRRADALLVAGTVIGGRLAVEVAKLVVARPRPDLAPFPVDVTSLSFPSGHAANSMTTFLALALVLAPARARALAVATAVLASLLVGVTRPLLGVHWPTDVLAGWAFGIGWVSACRLLVRRRGGTAA